MKSVDPRGKKISRRHRDEALPKFRQIVPKEMLNRLSHPLSDRKPAAMAGE